MLFVVDIGNTNIVLAINDKDEWIELWRIHTDAKKTSDEYFLDVKEIVASIEREIKIGKVVISSVVPSLTMVFQKVCFRLFGVKGLVVDHTVKTGLVPSSVPAEMGTDILANLVAAHHLFPDNYATVLDFGTALTVSTVSPEGEVLGVAIAPGLITSVNALAGNTAQLPYIELKKPDSVLGRNTVQSIRAGIMLGFAGLVDSLVKKTEEEIGTQVKVVVTGGLSKTISSLLSRVDYLEKNHTLNGLVLLSRMNS